MKKKNSVAFARQGCYQGEDDLSDEERKQGVACYLAYLLETGKDDTEHVTRLEEVLKRLHKHGVHVKRSKCQFLNAILKGF